jgi:subtilisin-like proprotein convertase family protein
MRRDDGFHYSPKNEAGSCVVGGMCLAIVVVGLLVMLVGGGLFTYRTIRTGGVPGGAPGPSGSGSYGWTSGMNVPIPDGKPTGVTQTHTVNVSGVPSGAALLTDVGVSVGLTHPRPADVELSVIHADGTVALLRPSGDSSPLATSYSAASLPALAAFNGKALAGLWKLRVKDVKTGRKGTLQSWGLNLQYAW